MDLSTIRKIVQALEDMDVVHVTLTGGEPLLREDLEEVVAMFEDIACEETEAGQQAHSRRSLPWNAFPGQESAGKAGLGRQGFFRGRRCFGGPAKPRWARSHRIYLGARLHTAGPFL